MRAQLALPLPCPSPHQQAKVFALQSWKAHSTCPHGQGCATRALCIYDKAFYWDRKLDHLTQYCLYCGSPGIQTGLSPSYTWRCQGSNWRHSPCKAAGPPPWYSPTIIPIFCQTPYDSGLSNFLALLKMTLCRRVKINLFVYSFICNTPNPFLIMQPPIPEKRC